MTADSFGIAPESPVPLTGPRPAQSRSRVEIVAILLAEACCLTWLGSTAAAQPAGKSPPAPVPVAAPPRPPAQVKVVAGVVGEGGTVRYLPRVTVRLMPRAYSDAERMATETYSAEIDALKRARDTTIKELVKGRPSELAAANEEYEKDLRMALASLTLDPNQEGVVDPDQEIGGLLEGRLRLMYPRYHALSAVPLSPQLRKLLVHPAVIGAFDVRTFNQENTPIIRNPKDALSAIPLESYQQVPEFSKQIQKAVNKERAQAKLKGGAAFPPEVAKAAVLLFVDEWFKEATSTHLENYGGVGPDAFGVTATLLQAACDRAAKSTTDAQLSALIAAKDRINARYDSQQAEADATFKLDAETAERKRAAAISSAMERMPPVQETSTSLQGEAVLTVSAGDFTIIAEDTTTDQHLRWSIPVPPPSAPSQTIELTDANALKATPSSVASPAAQMSYPRAADLSATERAEYDLRYGSRLLKSWGSIATLHDATATGDGLKVVDSPLGFAFQLDAENTNVFNTLRMSDNDIAARLFNDLVVLYLQALPENLRTIGGSQAFEAVRLQVTGRKKSFIEEDTTGDAFLLTYTFRIGDVESYANQKIDGQQLLDRGHITRDQGRISVRLVSAQ